MNRPHRLRLLALLALLPFVAAIFWLTAVATSGLPGIAVFAINVHALTLNDPSRTFRPAPLSLSVLDDAQLDEQAAAAEPTSMPMPTWIGPTTPVTKPTAGPTRAANPTPTPTSSSMPTPLPTVPVPTPFPTPVSGTIAGQVVDSVTNSPIAGAVVSMSPPAATGFTDSSGNFALIVPPGSYTVTVTAAGYSSASQVVSVRSGQRKSLLFRLTTVTTYGSITGSVSDWTTGSPIVGATVSLSDGLATLTDSNGNFSFPVVPIGSYILTVSAINYKSQSFSVTVKGGHTTNVKVSLIHV